MSSECFAFLSLYEKVTSLIVSILLIFILQQTLVVLPLPREAGCALSTHDPIVMKLFKRSDLATTGVFMFENTSAHMFSSVSLMVANTEIVNCLSHNCLSFLQWFLLQEMAA